MFITAQALIGNLTKAHSGGPGKLVKAISDKAAV
jgi:hypothetical protein